MEKVTMTCMTTKQKFEVDEAPVVVLANGRYAYRVKCPWEGKNGKELYAFKFCSAAAHAKFAASQKVDKEEDEKEDEYSSPERKGQQEDEYSTPERKGQLDADSDESKGPN